MDVDTIRISSKGQVVIPARVRRQLKLETGDELAVEIGPEGDAILLRRRRPSEMERRIEQGYRWLERSGADPVESLHASRRRARARERSSGRP